MISIKPPLNLLSDTAASSNSASAPACSKSARNSSSTEPILDTKAKRYAIENLTSQFGIEPFETVAVGDGANDIKLFDICNLGIAYRAQDLVKDLATTTLEEKDLTKIIPIINEHYSMELPMPVSS